MTFFCKLHPPRPTFAFDMSDDERELMQRHAEYWTHGLGQGQVVAFGPVADAGSSFGIGIVEVADEQAMERFAAGDPVIVAGRGFRYEVLPMPFGVIHR